MCVLLQINFSGHVAWCGNQTLLGMCADKERTTLEAIASRSVLYYMSNPVDLSRRFDLEKELRKVHCLGEFVYHCNIISQL